MNKPKDDVRARKYPQILKLYEYCKKIGIDAELSELYDGYKITFANGSDVVQHAYSYLGSQGCVEPAIRSKLDYSPTELKNAKQLVCRHKERLNGKKNDL